MPSLTIDGKPVEFKPGETVIEAATRNDVEIPYYCWHPRLSIAANCRMCLVEVIGAPKLLPSCQTECREGMEVNTGNERVKGAQNAVHEFLLVNHPIDCPICDQAGECKLQDYYMKFDLTGSRMEDRKVNKPRLEDFGPYVKYNAERCIMCTRCVRFMDEVAGERQLGVFNRGDHAEIGVFENQPLDSAYSMNTVDICPVGALTSRAFRFKQRSWNLSRTDSLCGGCAKGCNIHADARSGQVYRYLPRENEHVNKSWLCDEGRLGYTLANDARLYEPFAVAEGASESEKVQLGAALERFAQVWRGGVDKKPHVVFDLHASCEDVFLIASLLKDVFQVTDVAVAGYLDGEADDVLRVADKNPNRAGITQVLKALGMNIQPIDSGADNIWVFGTHIGASVLVDLLNVELVFSVHDHVMVQKAGLALPLRHHVQSEGMWVNSDGIVQALSAGLEVYGQERSFRAWFELLAPRVGLDWKYEDHQSLRDDLQALLPDLVPTPAKSHPLYILEENSETAEVTA